ncbi:MAG: hypothetical protein IKX22_09825 [Prevotella sp.]|nr:hypothetical protein [Prevotella sp.]
MSQFTSSMTTPTPYYIIKGIKGTKMVLVSMLMLLCMSHHVNVQAQVEGQQLSATLVYTTVSPDGGRILAKGPVGLLPLPQVSIDPLTKEETAVWIPTNNAWIKDSVWAKEVHLAEHLERYFPNTPFDPNLLRLIEQNGPDYHNPWDDYVPFSWMLSEESGETVLHCYVKMPADIVTRLWLASEETCLVDRETGTQYRIRRTEPECIRKHLSFKAPKDSILDFRIYFPPLAESTKEVTIFGVPGWGLIGNPITVRPHYEGRVNYYDTIPLLRRPRLLLEHVSEDALYDKQNWNTWKVYTDAHLIKPLADNTMAIWQTPDATYLAVAYEQNWTREYFGWEPGAMLVDESGMQYHLREVQGVPKDEVFFMEGNAGDYIAYLMVFDPVPLDKPTISYIEPSGEPFNAWGANWNGLVLPNLDVEALRKNQPLFNYHPREVVK